MSPSDFLHSAIRPALLKLPQKMRSLEAEVMILAICLQESGLKHRRQIGGPARGYAQFELSGGVQGVLTHPATKVQAESLCAILDVPAQPETVYEALAWHDVLAVVFARLLLWSDPAPLPLESEMDKGWDYYLRTWRPGKPHPERWPENWNRAWATV